MLIISVGLSFAALRRTAAVAAPAMLAGGALDALANPGRSSNRRDPAHAASSRRAAARAPIVVNYSPNLTIQTQDGEDDGTLSRRVMDILERHGRELHQVLARELTRRQRMEFGG